MDNPNGKTIGVVAAAIVLLALLGTYVFTTGPSDQTEKRAGGQRAGLQEFTDGITSGPNGIAEVWFSQTLPAGSEEVLLIRNQSGKDAILHYGESNVISGATASSSYKLFLVATSSSSIGAWADVAGTAVSTGKNALINGVTIATSTTASTTSSVYANDAGVGNGSVLVPNGWYVFGFLQALDAMACADGACEPATSTNRGFNPQFRVRIHY